jgi:hypothetical protein
MYMGEKMRSNQHIGQVLEQFSDWTMPWAYIRETLTAKGLAGQDGALVEEIWQEVNSSAHWIEPSFQSGADLATAALRAKYSWLSEGAIRNLVRGASYMWK